MKEFDRFAADYRDVLDDSLGACGDTSEYYARYKSCYLRRLLGPLGRIKVLDFGCGVGLLAQYLKTDLPQATVHGFDVSESSIAQVNPALKAEGTFTADANELDADYDAIIVANVMHHIEPAQRAATVQQMAARMAPRGQLVVIEHNPLNPLTRSVVRNCPFDEGVILLTPRELSGYVRGARLTALRRDYIVFFPKLLAFLQGLEPWLSWCPLGAQFAIVARAE